MENINVMSASKDEFEKVIELINTAFRTSRGFDPTMQQEFPLLLCKENVQNMIIAQINGKPVSCANFVPQKIQVQSALISAASVGAVCTCEDHRGYGISSAVLDTAEEKMLQSGIDIVLISGERSLYTRRGCLKIENFIEYTVNPQNMDLDFEIAPCEETHLDDIIKSYNQLSTRYSRSKDEFEALLASATIPWGAFTYKKYVLLENGLFKGYMVIRIIDSDERYGQVIESFASPSHLYRALSNLACELSLSRIKHYVHKEDYVNRLDSYCHGRSCHLHGTLKILSPERLFKSLEPYFAQCAKNSTLENLRFEFSSGKYIISLEDEHLDVGSLESLTRLVFEGASSLEIQKSDAPRLCSFFESAFPIPFVWSANLNYQ